MQNTASNSDYYYHVNRSGPVQVVVIEDQNKGRTSVTTNIEAVVCDVIEKLGLNLSDMGDKYHVIYRDGLGIYDGVIPVGQPENKVFTFLSLTNYKQLVTQIKIDIEAMKFVTSETEAVRLITGRLARRGKNEI